MGNHEREGRALRQDHEHADARAGEAEQAPPSEEKAQADAAAGDAAVRRLAGGAQLAVGHAGDEHEQEADHVADEVVGEEHEAHGEPGEHAPVEHAQAQAQAPSLQMKSREGAPAQVAAEEAAPSGGGQPLPQAQRDYFEQRMGRDFGDVRIHAGAPDGARAEKMNAHAYTVGRDITFAPGQYRPDSTDGQKLLAHELTHVAQQSAAGPKVQLRHHNHNHHHRHHHHKSGNVFSRLGRNLRRIGRDVERGFKTYGLGFGLGPGLVGDILGGRFPQLGLEPDAVSVLANHGWGAFCTYMVEKFTNGSASAEVAILQMLNVVPDGPELLELITRLLSHLRPLNGEEKSAVQFVLGDSAIDWSLVRVAQSGAFPRLLQSLQNGGNRKLPSMTLAHTIFRAPSAGTDVIVHECTHVFQYERLGLQYIPEAIEAQRSKVDYSIGVNHGGVNQSDALGGHFTSAGGGSPTSPRQGTAQDQIDEARQAAQADGGDSSSQMGLVAAVKRGKHYHDFNREQQAQLAQEFYEAYFPSQPWQPVAAEQVNDAHAAYCFFIGELRKGQF